ncbi:hypothetical protein [Deinococcus aetherius]|nr:hypothetical protein [Deinococcus aetherius]
MTPQDCPPMPSLFPPDARLPFLPGGGTAGASRAASQRSSRLHRECP